MALLCGLGALALYHLVVWQVSQGELSPAPFLLAALLLWCLGLGLLGWRRREARAADDRLAALAGQLAQEGSGGSSRPAGASGPERHILALGQHLRAARAERDDARHLGHLLIQTGGQYTLLCTLEGQVLDANAAFLARTGISPAQLRASPGTALDGVLDIAPLVPLATRSLEERATITGLRHALRVGDEVRPVEVSVRGLRARGAPLMILVMIDKAQEARLEQQIDQFTDALELMVDQRVARLTARQSAVEGLLARAGLALFVFDDEGRLESMNAAAEALTGRTALTLGALADVAALLLPQRPAADALLRWVLGAEGQPRQETIATAAGARRAVLLRAAEARPGAPARRLLVVVPSPQAPASDASAAADWLRRLEALADRIDEREPGAEARAFLEGVREMLRHLQPGASHGDGAPGKVVSPRG